MSGPLQKKKALNFREEYNEFFFVQVHDHVE